MSNVEPSSAVVVIGAGATGGWVAKTLTGHGIPVMLLDAGPVRTVEEMAGRLGVAQHVGAGPSAEENDLSRQAIQSRHPQFSAATSRLFVDDLDHPYSVPDDRPFFWIRGRQVGGRTLTWGGVSLRLSDFDFKAGSLDGLSPDWPIDSSDLAPYYAKVESFLGVRGTLESVASCPDGVYAAPSELSPAELIFRERIEREVTGLRMIPNRGLVMSRLASGEWPRYTAQGSTLKDALATGLLEVVPDTICARLLHDAGAGRKIEGVEVVDRVSGEIRQIRGRAVVLCASTFETVRLLLNSASDRHPDGIGNSSGVLGLNIMDHWNLRIAGVAPWLAGVELTDRFLGADTFLVPRFHNVGRRSEEFARGFGIQGGIGREVPLKFYSPGECPVVLSACGEMLPRPENRIYLDGNKDRWGVPTIGISCAAQSPDDVRLREGCRAFMRGIMSSLDLTLRVPEWLTGVPVPGLAIHETGGARWGSRPEDSVVDPGGRVWDTDNLFIADGSVFPTSAWQNSTLTMMAVATRTADHVSRSL